MRVLVRGVRLAPPARSVARARSQGEERRAWVEALFGNHLPREPWLREEAIDVLAGDSQVWGHLHQARHSMVETTALIERLALGAVAEVATPKAA